MKTKLVYNVVFWTLSIALFYYLKQQRFYRDWPLNNACKQVLDLMYMFLSFFFFHFVLTLADGLCCGWFLYPFYRDMTSRQGGRPTKTTQQNSDRINIWSQVPRWARHQDILTD
jgi:hypothetical protein